MNRLIIWSIISLLFAGTSCKDTTSVKNEKEYVSLLKYGIPFDLKAPEDVHIRASASGNQRNVFVSNNKNYDIHISMSAALNRNRENLKAQTKKALVEDPNFSKIIEEIESGFIYEKEYGDTKGYDFYLVIIQGNHELTFQCGNGGIYTETEVKNMVRSVLSEY